MKFEEIGIQYQYSANNIEQAQKSFKYSCDCCCAKGRNVPCDRCPIAQAHSLVVAFFNDQQ